MSGKEKAAPDVATIESGKGKSESVAALDCSPVHHTTAGSDKQAIAGFFAYRAEDTAGFIRFSTEGEETHGEE